MVVFENDGDRHQLIQVAEIGGITNGVIEVLLPFFTLLLAGEVLVGPRLG